MAKSPVERAISAGFKKRDAGNRETGLTPLSRRYIARLAADGHDPAHADFVSEGLEKVAELRARVPHSRAVLTEMRSVQDAMSAGYAEFYGLSEAESEPYVPSRTVDLYELQLQAHEQRGA
jgi:hypothetical protein